MLKILSVFVVVLLGMGVISCSEPTELEEENVAQSESEVPKKSFDELYSEADQLLRSGKTLEAIPLLEEAVAINDTNIGIYEALGYAYGSQCFSKKMGCDEAIKYYTRLIELEPTYNYCFFNRANCYMASGEYDKAIADYTHQIEHLSDPPADSYGNRALCHLYNGDIKAANSDYKNACKLKSTKTSAYSEQLTSVALEVGIDPDELEIIH